LSFGTLSLKNRALRHLSQREHSRAELERKLSKHLANTARDAANARPGEPADAEESCADTASADIAQALDQLAAAGLIDEGRVAESVLNHRGRSHGVRRLRQDLQAKGLDAELVQSTLQQARSTELARAREVWQRRFGHPPADAAERARQLRFLLGRGFETQTALKVVQPNPDEDLD
jgi:regulatory protein